MNEHTRNEVVRRHLSGQSQRSIARELGISRPTVRRIVARYQQHREEGAPCPELPERRASRKSLLDPFQETIGQLLARYLLGYSRRQYLHFTESQDMETTLREHIRAFRHLGGVAATCLYDNMKVVVTRYEDDQPIYNTRFLSFATHYGYRPRACRPRRPQTKGKVERPFLYVQTSLLNGRTFRSLEHLNEVTRWWLENIADVRVHRTTKRRPVDAHAEELPHLLPLPTHDYDTSRVVYRLVNDDGFVSYRNNDYSAPWRYLGQTLPVRITDEELIIYSLQIAPVARHGLVPSNQTGQKRFDPSHRPPRDARQQVQRLRERFAQWNEVGTRFLEGLLAKHRHGKALAQKVLLLVRAYHQQDVVRAMERAVRYQAFSPTSLERILAVQAQPKAAWLQSAGVRALEELNPLPHVPPRSTADYQHLLFSEVDHDEPSEHDQQPREANTDHQVTGSDSADRPTENPPPDAENPTDGRADGPTDSAG